MKDLISILAQPKLHEPAHDFYLPTDEENRRARDAYEALRVEEEGDPQNDHLTADEFQTFLMSLAQDLVDDGDLTPEEWAELQDELEKEGEEND